MALDAFDDMTGLSALYVLSVLHVLLEFPLDHVEPTKRYRRRTGLQPDNSATSE